MRLLITVLLVLAFPVVSAVALQQDETCAGGNGHGRDCTACHTLGVEEAGKLLADIGKVLGVKHSAVSGLFEVTLESQGKQGTAYVDFAKKHVVAGQVFSIGTLKPATGGQTQPQQPKPVKIDISSLPTANSIVLGNPNGKKRLFVFTDPDCPFCSKLHLELIKLIYMEPDLGIFVKMFPLKMHPAAYDKARVILGGADPAYLLNRAFSGEQLPPPGPKDAKEPVDETIRLGESIGITATPTLVLPDGTVSPGFRDAAELKRMISGN